jgi:hypothetical protein
MKTEKQKMLAGEPYRSRDPELLAMYHRARDLLATFAAVPSSKAEEKREVLLKLLGGLGSGYVDRSAVLLRRRREHQPGVRLLHQCQLRLPRLQYDNDRKQRVDRAGSTALYGDAPSRRVGPVAI